MLTVWRRNNYHEKRSRATEVMATVTQVSYNEYMNVGAMLMVQELEASVKVCLLSARVQQANKPKDYY